MRSIIFLSLLTSLFSFSPAVEKQIDPVKVINNDSINEDILPDGKYTFDIVFSEWDGKSMGETVTVIIEGQSIKVIYDGVGSIFNKGQIIEEGSIMKHKSGKWIIGTKKEDTNLNEIAGCTAGPTVIDFKNKKYWMC